MFTPSVLPQCSHFCQQREKKNQTQAHQIPSVRRHTQIIDRFSALAASEEHFWNPQRAGDVCPVPISCSLHGASLFGAQTTALQKKINKHTINSSTHHILRVCCTALTRPAFFRHLANYATSDKSNIGIRLSTAYSEDSRNIQRERRCCIFRKTQWDFHLVFSP